LLVKKLINSDVDINSQDNEGRTPIYYFFIKPDDSSDTNTPIESIHFLKKLYEFTEEKALDIKLNTKDKCGNNPIHYAAQRSAIYSTLFLVEKGANLEDINDHGNTPLAIAVKNGHIDYTRILIQNLANVDEPLYLEVQSITFEKDKN